MVFDRFIDVTITGGTGNYIYTWTADNGFTAPTDDISNLSAGNYSLSVVDENDCPITLDVEITEPDPIEIVSTASNENGFGVLCNGDSNGL